MEDVMKKIVLVFVFFGLGISAFAAGEMDASMVSDDDIARVEKIVEALDPEYAIQTALTSFPKEAFPLYRYLKNQEMKINRIFNEYGVEFSKYDSYAGLSPRAQTVFQKLKSRYSYLHAMTLQDSDGLKANLVLLQE
jgi:hypothetical protein